jgi:hypothetical protein
MAPVLQCPDCKTKHPLDQIGDRTAFACEGCGRMLKVPEMARARQAASANDAAAAPPPRAEPTTVMPAAAPPPPADPYPPAAAPAGVSARAKVPWWMRLLLWIVAVPLSFLIVFFIAQATGTFTHTQLTDVFLANNRARFWPVVRLLPFVAVLIALMVQGGVILLSRRKARPRQAQGSTTRGQREASTPSTRTSRS